MKKKFVLRLVVFIIQKMFKFHERFIFQSLLYTKDLSFDCKNETGKMCRTVEEGTCITYLILDRGQLGTGIDIQM